MLFWACMLSAMAPVCVGFFWGGWVTAGEAHRMAATAVSRARTELATEVCFNRFLAAPDVAAHLAELRDADPWARGDLLVHDGWATIPGAKKHDDITVDRSYIGETCARRLLNAAQRSQDKQAMR
jgi:hypothetical protein